MNIASMIYNYVIKNPEAAFSILLKIMNNQSTSFLGIMSSEKARFIYRRDHKMSSSRRAIMVGIISGGAFIIHDTFHQNANRANASEMATNALALETRKHEFEVRKYNDQQAAKDRWFVRK